MTDFETNPTGTQRVLDEKDQRIAELEAQIRRLNELWVDESSAHDATMFAKHKALAENERLTAELKLLRKQKQIATQALFDVCQSDWGIGHSIARPAHKAIKEMAALKTDDGR